ncbi:hypothetical protein HOD20_05500 [archaeon]|mgnify:CR=1 FL=1|jgi:MtN3 and saliva related transmembrane protein|nr:hypothetical protein [archaeon]MBT4351958.1 hypothetical protein [archaeon]MBT4647404.1 hypothetical protein [archaeon]MBT6821307.1 hypothetical protein [archaeon]MBT7392860.1 hypothetical protein [archaeon]
MIEFWEIWGIVAGVITTSGYIPQIIQGYKTKSLKDLSYLLNTLMGFGMLMWLVYGISLKSIALIISNTLGVSLNLALIFMKYYYAKKQISKN